MEKSCRYCKHNSSCRMLNRITSSDLETAIECKLEEGFLDGTLKEHFNLTEIYERLQDEGIIKKNIKIKDIDIDGTIANFLEKLHDDLWTAIVNNLGTIKPEQDKMTDSDFYCSEWE